MHLRLKPVRELDKYREELNAVREADGIYFYSSDAGHAVEILIELQEKVDFAVAIGQVKVQYEAQGRSLRVAGCKANKDEAGWRQAEKNISGKEGVIKEIVPDRGPEKISLLVDREIMEITIDDGLVCACYEIPCVKKGQILDLSVETKGEIKAYRIL